LLLSGCVTAIGGATALALTQQALRDEDGNSIPICHSFTADTVGALIRVTQREVPPGVMVAARAAPEFADSDPPLWEGSDRRPTR
jgi:hypothetical protein